VISDLNLQEAYKCKMLHLYCIFTLFLSSTYTSLVVIYA